MNHLNPSEIEAAAIASALSVYFETLSKYDAQDNRKRYLSPWQTDVIGRVSFSNKSFNSGWQNRLRK